MSSAIKNILLILTFVILLPISVFTVMEIGSLNENEAALENVYREQLDAIIFSINQYSGDIFSFYVNQVELEYTRSDNSNLVNDTFVQQNLAIASIGVKTNDRTLVSNLQSINLTENQVDSIVGNNVELIERLRRYKETSYVKPEPLGQIQIDDVFYNAILVIIGENAPCVVLVDPVPFIEDLLAPKMQEIATQDLDISVRYIPSGRLVFANSDSTSGIVQTRDLWLLPNYELGVSLRGESVEELIAYRTKRNIVALGMLITLVIIGAILVVRNLRKEMQLSKAKADFVANVSHEIRTPLALISMFNETLLLDRVKDDKKKMEYYEIISKETSRLKNIVNKILSFSQIDADKKNYQFVEMNPNTEIKDVVNSYSYHLEEKGFEYELELCNENVAIKADKGAFIEVIINLIDNAIKYSMDTRLLKIKTYVATDGFFIEVLDKGVGIPSDKIDQVFEKFYRVTGGDVHDTKGTGLGLSLVSGIMQAHNGAVEVKSKPGEGSTFILKFPLDHGA